jgi:hypothetical protein
MNAECGIENGFADLILGHVFLCVLRVLRGESFSRS